MARRFSIEAVFKAVDRMTAPITRIQNRVQKMTRSMKRGFTKLNRVVDKFGRGLKRGAQVAVVSFALISGAMANVLGAGADFEQAITNVGAVALRTRSQIAPLEKLALQLGKTTKFTATQAANAMEVLARAGFDTQQILAATPAILSAAAASGLEIAEVANHVSNVLKGMGLETTEAARVADVLALASARTNSSIGSLGESMKNVASTARQLNIPLEDVVASVALLQDVGLDASVAGSAFNVMLTKMAAPSASIAKTMRRLNVSFKDAKGNMKALPTVISEINKASKKMGGNFDQVAFLAELVGLRGQKAAANLADLFESGKLEKLTKELLRAEGSAKKMADIRMNTVQGSLLLLGSAVDAVKVKIFDLNKGPLKGLIDGFTEWVNINGEVVANDVGEFIGELITNLPLIVQSIKNVTKGIAAFIVFSVVLKTFIGVMTLVNLVMMANPLVLIIAGVVLAIAAFTAVVVWVDRFTATFDRMNPVLRALLFPMELIIRSIKFIKDLLEGGFKFAIGDDIANGFMASWGSVKQFFADLWSDVISIFDSAVAKIMNIVNKVKGISSGVFDTLSNIGGGIAATLGLSDAPPESKSPQIVSPQERVARSIEEQRTTSTAEVTIRDESGRAEVTSGSIGRGLSLQQSGSF